MHWSVLHICWRQRTNIRIILSLHIYIYIVNNIAHQGESLFRQTKRCYHHYYPSSNCVYDVILSTWIAETLAGIAQTDRQTADNSWSRRMGWNYTRERASEKYAQYEARKEWGRASETDRAKKVSKTYTNGKSQREREWVRAAAQTRGGRRCGSE